MQHIACVGRKASGIMCINSEDFALLLLGKMKLTKVARDTIVSLSQSGHQPMAIVRLLPHLKLTYQAVYRTLQRYRQTGSTDDRPRSGRPVSERTKQLVKKIHS